MERIWGENEKMEGENGEMERGGKNGERGKNGEGKTFTPSLCLLFFAFASLFPHFLSLHFFKVFKCNLSCSNSGTPSFFTGLFWNPLNMEQKFQQFKSFFFSHFRVI